MKSPKVRVGMGGWQLDAFNGVFYPENPPKGFRKLGYFSRYFDMVEVNATFYTTELTARNAHQWMDDVSANEDFIFSVKLYKGFTHSMDATQSDVARVHRLVEPMAAEEKLFGLVVQFPSSFFSSDENKSHLLKIGKAFSAFPLFVEVRHASWNSPEVLKFLEENKLHLVNVDLPPFKRHMPLTNVGWGGLAYFRLMGRNKGNWDRPPRKGEDEQERKDSRYTYRYSDGELNEILAKIKELVIDETALILHNDPQGNSLYNGLQIRHTIEPDRKLLAPPSLVNAFPDLKPFVEEEARR